MTFCDHTDPDTCPGFACWEILRVRGIDVSSERQPSALERRIAAAWRMEPLPGRLSTGGLRGRGDLAAAC